MKSSESHGRGSMPRNNAKLRVGLPERGSLETLAGQVSRPCAGADGQSPRSGAGPGLVRDVTRYLRGWGQYFAYGYPRRMYNRADSFVLQRLVRHLQRRSQRPFRPAEGKTVPRPTAIPGIAAPGTDSGTTAG
jgi:hypothetical protein